MQPEPERLMGWVSLPISHMLSEDPSPVNAGQRPEVGLDPGSRPEPFADEYTRS